MTPKFITDASARESLSDLREAYTEFIDWQIEFRKLINFGEKKQAKFLTPCDHTGYILWKQAFFDLTWLKSEWPDKTVA